MSYSGLDVLLTGLLAFSMIAGLRQGLVRALGGIFSAILGVVIATASYKQLAFWLEKAWGLQSLLAAWIAKKIDVVTIPTMGLIDNPLVGVVEPAQYLAYLALLALSFLALLFIIMQIGHLLAALIHQIFDKSCFSGVNRLLGMAAQLLKYSLIIAVIIGIIYPVAKSGAQMGLGTASLAYNKIESSVLAKWFLDLFTMLQASLGINV